ncbi:nucleic acid-binding protein, partial [Microstroma glucosiphilum]
MTIINEPRKSFCWVFDSPTGEERGVKAAFEELKKAGAMRVDLAWVRNHWIMILWKLAHYTRCKPQEAALWWCFEQVMRQLKYRYEREVNLAQRSAIKRIQERDSPASLPMILRVFGHHKVNAEDVDSLGAMSKVKDRTCGDYDYELELTDGWYRIRARMDPTLSRAFKRGKIAQGMKLAIQGARL